jgi:arylsulfatase A-like enzyme
MNFGRLSDIPEWQAGRIKHKPGARGWYYRDATPFRYVDDTNRDRMPDEITVDYACEVMQRKHDKPFFIGVGLTKPHTPLYVPDEYFDRYPIDEVTLPPYLENDLDDCAEALRSRFAWGFQKFEALIASSGEDGWRGFVQAYLATVSFVDDQIGRLMETLESEGHLDNTLILFTSDNGYHLGEKDCIQKWHLWDESTRLPMMICAPGKPGNGRDCNHPVSHIDLYPTLNDLCGLPTQPHRGSETLLDGHSLYPLLEDPENGKWQGPPVALVGIRGDLANMDKDQPPHFSVCSDRYRYTLCANSEEELYDHYDDPHEWTNLTHSAVHQETKAQLRQELMSLLENSKVPDNYKPNKIGGHPT